MLLCEICEPEQLDERLRDKLAAAALGVAALTSPMTAQASNSVDVGTAISQASPEQRAKMQEYQQVLPMYLQRAIQDFMEDEGLSSQKEISSSEMRILRIKAEEAAKIKVYGVQKNSSGNTVLSPFNQSNQSQQTINKPGSEVKRTRMTDW